MEKEWRTTVHLSDGRAVIVFKDPDGRSLYSGIVIHHASNGRWYSDGCTRDYEIDAPDAETAAQKIVRHVDNGDGVYDPLDSKTPYLDPDSR